jgi:hypothetical protein
MNGLQATMQQAVRGVGVVRLLAQGGLSQVNGLSPKSPTTLPLDDPLAPGMISDPPSPAPLAL